MALVHGKMLLMKLTLVLLAAATTSLAAAADKPLPPPQAKLNCPDRCGDITIPYPFGIGDDCYILLEGQENQFELTCNYSTTPPSLNWKQNPELSITNFNLTEGELEAPNFISKDCYDESGSNLENIEPYIVWDRPFSISGSKNRFTAVGCNTIAAFQGFGGEEEFLTGCFSVCPNISSVDQSSCTGVGCCQTKIPEGLKNLTVTLLSFPNHTDVWKFNPCSYAFLARDGYFNFSGTSSFEQLNKMDQIPMVVNWQIGDETCEVAENAVEYACKANSTCVNQTKGPYPGYYCQCLRGYEGNPYIGCRDIDECLAEINPCGNGTCQNSLASYSCKCNKGFKNDGPLKCIARPTANKTLKISLGICIGFFVLLVVIFGLYCGYKRRQFNDMKKKYFEAHGGPKLLQQLKQLASKKDRFFTAEELKKATKDFDADEKIVGGGHGTVYKGVLEDKRVVAIKTTQRGVGSDQFINEVVVLSQISHRNVVRLLGCCLEIETPSLVYEYVGNTTLYDHIHKKNAEPLSFAQRLKIATETARTLSYLHRSAIPRVIHGNVNATNILLDEKLMAKVTDFGASMLVPDDDKTLEQGKKGYLDPENLRSDTLTEQSDVYSFGGVLVELLTGENAVRFDKPEAERNLGNVLVSTINKGPPHQILDGEIVKDGNWEIIKSVAKLAEECLSVKRAERPPMEVVEMKLYEMLITLEKQPGGKKLRASSSIETDHSPESLSNTCIVEVSGEDDGGSMGIISSAEYDVSRQNQAQQPFHDGR